MDAQISYLKYMHISSISDVKKNNPLATEQQTSEEEHWSVMLSDAQLLAMTDFRVHSLRIF